VKTAPKSQSPEAHKRYTCKELAALTGRSVSTIKNDARNPDCPLYESLLKLPNQRAKVAEAGTAARYLEWTKVRAGIAG
jgi:hypothetical protein